MMTRDDLLHVLSNPEGVMPEDALRASQAYDALPAPARADLMHQLHAATGAGDTLSEAAAQRAASLFALLLPVHAQAMRSRAAGDIDRATRLERDRERFYSHLPDWARW